MEQRTNMQPFVAPKPRPKVGGKPAIAAKPSHLKKEPSFDKSATGVNKNLAKQPSLNHMTPKVWVKAPLVRENEHKPVHQDPPQRKVPPSPFGSSVWRPVHQMHTKPAVEKKLSNGSTQKPEIVPPTLVETREDEKFPEDDTKTLTGEIDKKEEFSKPSNLKFSPTLSGPRTPIPYRPSMRRDAKSPGMGNLIKMWDTKTKEAPQSREPLQAIKQRSNTHQGETWKSVSMHKKQSVDENNSTHDSGSAFRNRASSIQFQSPKPYINRSSAKSYQHSESTGTLIVSTNDQTFAFDESAIHKYSANPEEENSSVQAKAPKPEETHSNVETRMTSQEILANADVAIYNIPSDSDSLEDNPGMNIATYEDFDETDSGVTSAVYAVADDVPYPPHHSASIRSLQGYLPMSGNVPDSMVEIRYERMSQEVHLPSSNYGSQVVPPPAVKPKSTPEYHEIDPNGKKK
uniref:Uncharacterized protein LOC100176478 n=1 Tax=Phallusia mammillata TaxID=59560 RepID=A0A6F9DHD3_9ASCI|nr:uncharacterized protein LOC100176478 [Phallusia mammillata]